MVQKILLLALAGALGTIARYGLAELIQKTHNHPTLWGTLAVNLIGCFLAGLVWAAFEHRWPASQDSRMLLMIGFMGAFTTFSAIMVETGEIVRTASWLQGVGHLLLHNGLGFAALVVGVALGTAGWGR